MMGTYRLGKLEMMAIEKMKMGVLQVVPWNGIIAQKLLLGIIGLIEHLEQLLR